MTWDPSGDFVIFDGAESIEYSQPGSAPLTVAGVLREQLSIADLRWQADLALQPTDTPFNLPGPNLGTLTPRPGDTLTDSANIAWTVISVEFQTLTNQYRVLARRQR